MLLVKFQADSQVFHLSYFASPAIRN
jgi:hypothetical protein